MMAGLLAMTLALAAAGDATSVVNPGFEQRDDRTGMPSGWFYTSLPGRVGLVHYVTKTVVTGDQESNALTISVAADHPAEDVAYNAHRDLRGMIAGKTYRISARMQTHGLSIAPMIAVQCLDADGTKYLGFARSNERNLSGDVKEWEPFETEVTIPKDTANVRLRIGIPAKGNAGGTAIIDDVEVVEVN